MDNRRIKTIQVRLTDKDTQMIESLSESVFGGASKSDVVRRCIQERYNKAFPAYKASKDRIKMIEEENLTPEQVCEKAGGTVGMINGIPSCTFRISESMTGSVPLTKPELYKKYKK